MATRILKSALAAAALVTAAGAQAAAPAGIAARSSASVEDAESLSGGSGFLPVAIFIAAVLAVMLFEDDDNDLPTSP